MFIENHLIPTTTKALIVVNLSIILPFEVVAPAEKQSAFGLSLERCFYHPKHVLQQCASETQFHHHTLYHIQSTCTALILEYLIFEKKIDL